MSESEPKFEQEPIKEIKDAESFDELYRILDNKKETAGGEGRIYTSKILKGIIEICRPKWDDTLCGDSMIDPLDEISLSFFKNRLNLIDDEELKNKVSELLYKELQNRNEKILELHKIMHNKKAKN